MIQHSEKRGLKNYILRFQPDKKKGEIPEFPHASILESKHTRIISGARAEILHMQI